jgi:hypothetical protein
MNTIILIAAAAQEVSTNEMIMYLGMLALCAFNTWLLLRK